MANSFISSLDRDRPILIAGPTASGKSSLALAIAGRFGGTIINADALQVYQDWRVLTARPNEDDEARVRHELYGHVPRTTAYSVGDWLRDIPKVLKSSTPIVVGGTGLYFTALTEGLAPVPPTPSGIREQAMQRIADDGVDSLLKELDTETKNRIDVANPMRVQRAWEVLRATGRGLASWHKETPEPMLDLNNCQAFVMDAPTEWLNDRISRRFDQMLDLGLLDEARGNLPGWHAQLPSSKSIGSAELMAHLRGEITLEEVKRATIMATRQYAKRQRTWFRSKMKSWTKIDACSLEIATGV